MSEKTFLAMLTPPGMGAIASIGLRGPQAWEIVRKLCRPARGTGRQLPAQPEVGQLWFCRIGNEPGEEVVISVKQTSPQPGLELHCHGGKEVKRFVQEELEAGGACLAEWSDIGFGAAETAFQAAALPALVQARTTRTAGILLDQFSGCFEQALRKVADSLGSRDFETGRALLGDLRGGIPLGRHLVHPFRVVVVGAPNVGKSSIVNALAGYSRCIVSPQPGTTRDLVTVTLAIDGWPVEIVDTAGLRAAADCLEDEGVRRARQALQEADLALWVLDASSTPVWPDSLGRPAKLVINKIDLPAAWPPEQAAEALLVSAQTGFGLDQLLQAISRTLVPHPPEPGTAVPFTLETCTLVEDCFQLTENGRFAEARALLTAFLEQTGVRPACASPENKKAHGQEARGQFG